MRTVLIIGLMAIAFGLITDQAQAQYYPSGFYSGGLAVNPYVLPPAYSAFAGYASPYGYRSYFNTGAYPGPWGYNTYYNYGTFVRPYVPGAFHSVIYNPFTRAYWYAPGYLNSPSFFYSYSGFPY